MIYARQENHYSNYNLPNTSLVKEDLKLVIYCGITFYK